MNHTDDVFNPNIPWGWLFFWGMALVVLGVIAISLSTVTTIISVVFLGALILIAGIVTIIDTFKFWGQRWGGFFIYLIMGILYLIVGISLISKPVMSAISLTLLLAIFFIVLGVFRIIFSLSSQLPNWGWSFFNGLVALALGILIFAHWPSSSLFIIGLFVGIDLLLLGWTYIIFSLSARIPSRTS